MISNLIKVKVREIMNMSRKKISERDKEFRKLQGNKLKHLIIERYGTKDFNEKFCSDYTLKGYGDLSSSRLSQIYAGAPMDSYIGAFSKVLKVRMEYLAYPDDNCKTNDDLRRLIDQEKADKEANEKTDYEERSRNSINDRIQIVKSVISYLLEKGVIVEYISDEGFMFVNKEGRFFSPDLKSDIEEDLFYRWLYTDMFSVKLSDNMYIHISRIAIISSCGSMTLSVPDFMRFVYDIDIEISHRVQTWIKLYNYNIKEDWDPAEAFIDLPVAEKRKEYKNE